MQPTTNSSLFGDPADFAIEAGIEAGLKPPSAVWGHMRVWCHGIPLGDIENLHCGLFSAYCGFKELEGHLDELWDDVLTGLGDAEVWDFLDGRLYGFDGRTSQEVAADSVRYWKFNFLTNWDEPFDHYKAFLLGPPGEPLHLLCRLPNNSRVSVRLSRSGFIDAAKQFCQWFDEQAGQLSGKTTDA